MTSDEFDRDLTRHFHLENDVLDPLAEALKLQFETSNSAPA